MSITRKEVEAFLEGYKKYLLSQLEEIENILQILPTDAIERAFLCKHPAEIAEKLNYYYGLYRISPHVLEEVFGKNKINFSKRGVPDNH